MLFCSASRFSSRSSVSPSSGAKARRWLATVAVAAHVAVTAVAAAMPAAAAVAIATIAVIVAVAAAVATRPAANQLAVVSRLVLRLARRPAVARAAWARAAWVRAAWVRAAKLVVPHPLPKLPRRLPRPSSSVAVLVWSASVANWREGIRPSFLSRFARPCGRINTFHHVGRVSHRETRPFFVALFGTD